jgi:hypothetical protein
MRDAWEPACSRKMITRPLVPGIWVEVAAEASEAVAALGYVVQWCGYHVRGGKETGAYNCRPITGGERYSLHAYGISVDINAYTNPYRTDRLVTDMPIAMIRGICRIRTKGGARVWRWGGDFDGDPERPDSVYDAMHFELQATPEELAAGIDWRTVEHPLMDPRRPSTWPVVIPGDRGPGVFELQRRLHIDADGAYGPITVGEVREYQGAHGLGVDGIVGPATWCALLTGQPVIPAHAAGPLKASSLHLSTVDVP